MDAEANSRTQKAIEKQNWKHRRVKKSGTLEEIVRLEELIQFQGSLIRDLEKQNSSLRRELDELQIQQLELMLFKIGSEIRQ
jgi:hypothetical protein